VKVLNLPDSGKDIGNGKGVHCEVESEGSRMANLWPDEQKLYQATSRSKAAYQITGTATL